MATETWVLNETISAPSNIIDENINFLCVATSQNFIRILIESEGKGVHLEYFAQGDSSTSGTSVLIGGTAVATEYRTLAFSTAPTGTLLTWLQANGTKQSTPKVTIDFTSLSGYESLSAGTYALSVKAKAAGYQDSDLSSTVSFTKLAAPVATASDTTVTWEAVANAVSYDIYVDDELWENTTGG